MKTCKEIRLANNLEITEKLRNIQLEEVPKEDTHLPSFIRMLKEKVVEEDYSEMDIITFEKQMNKGIISEKKMTEYHDYLITSMNLTNPSDSNSNERDDEQAFPNVHPCTNGHLKNDHSHVVRGEDEQSTYCNICNFCERHRHNKGIYFHKYI